MRCIMPERLATTDTFRHVTEVIGSGPYRFLPTEFNAGERAAYEGFTGYLPRGGPKQALVHNRKMHVRAMQTRRTIQIDLTDGHIEPR